VTSGSSGSDASKLSGKDDPSGSDD
jgi:hypothetical protein